MYWDPLDNEWVCVFCGYRKPGFINTSSGYGDKESVVNKEE